MTPEQPQDVQIRVPEDRAAGDYANGFRVAANRHELVIDYIVNVDAPGLASTMELVRRVRVPISLAGALVKGICEARDGYETVFGTIHPPGLPPTKGSGQTLRRSS